jgi:hypothetical protein
VTPRHAAALILTGWYLMVLPRTGPGVATISPPVWSAILHSYDTAKECERARVKTPVPAQPPAFGQTTELALYCVASNDPRVP